MKLDRITWSYLFLWVEAPEALHCSPRLRKCSKNKSDNIVNLGRFWNNMWCEWGRRGCIWAHTLSEWSVPFPESFSTWSRASRIHIQFRKNIFVGIWGSGVRKYIYIYISEWGVSPNGYFIPAHVGAGAGQVWRILPPAPYKGRKSQDISYLDGPDMGYLSGTKSL